MRVENWKPESVDEIFENATVERLLEAAEVVASAARGKCPVGTISRPIYKKGKYAGQPWTKRDAGALKKTIRITQKHSKSGIPLSRKRNVRVYAGNYLVYYASIVEHTTPFLRSALNNSITKIKSVLGAQ